MKTFSRVLLSLLIVLILICGFVLCVSAEGEDVEQPPEEEIAVQEEIAVTEEIGIARWESLLIALIPSAASVIGVIYLALNLVKQFKDLRRDVIDEATIKQIKSENKRLQEMMRSMVQTRSDDSKTIKELKLLMERQNKTIVDLYNKIGRA